mmetsp:Transcript_34143/g.102957  ORF Transcript_34143/g.102957 Transcript_34143/m.102957 type:complete len:402 (+) Transcript_34143:1524-2729(+)
MDFTIVALVVAGIKVPVLIGSARETLVGLGLNLLVKWSGVIGLLCYNGHPFRRKIWGSKQLHHKRRHRHCRRSAFRVVLHADPLTKGGEPSVQLVVHRHCDVPQAWRRRHGRAEVQLEMDAGGRPRDAPGRMAGSWFPREKRGRCRCAKVAELKCRWVGSNRGAPVVGGPELILVGWLPGAAPHVIWEMAHAAPCGLKHCDGRRSPVEPLTWNLRLLGGECQLVERHFGPKVDVEPERSLGVRRGVPERRDVAVKGGPRQAELRSVLGARRARDCGVVGRVAILPPRPARLDLQLVNKRLVPRDRLAKDKTEDAARDGCRKGPHLASGRGVDCVDTGHRRERWRTRGPLGRQRQVGLGRNGAEVGLAADHVAVLGGAQPAVGSHGEEALDQAVGKPYHPGI